MKRMIFAGLVMMLISCSVEKEGVNDLNITEVNAITTVDECIVYSFDFGTTGEIKVRNFYDYVEVIVTASNHLPISQLNLHFAENLNSFPTTGKGDLNPAQLMYENKFKDGIYQFTRTFSFEELSIQTLDQIYVAAYAEFGSGRNKQQLWAGDLKEAGANWSYFEYIVNPFKNYAGKDQLREITLSEATALPSWDEVRKVYAGMLDAGVNRKDGKYSPSIWELINDFNDSNRDSQLGDYTTTYTLGTGECSDSAELTLRVVPD